jgi:hypothetical protein
VQSYYNRFEGKYPIIDNIADERAAVHYAMDAEGGFQAAAASVAFIRFFLLGVSWRQFGQSLRDEGEAPEWDVERIQRTGGTRFVIESFPTADPLRVELQRRVGGHGVSLSAATLTADEIRAICDQRAALLEQAQRAGTAAGGVTECPRTHEGLGAISERFTGARDEIFSKHLKKISAALGQRSRRFNLFVYSHTHLVDDGFDPMRTENIGWDPRVVNTGAWQRVVSPEIVASWKVSAAEALRRGVDTLPACYSLVWVAPYMDNPVAEVRSWQQKDAGSWNFGPRCRG